MLTYQFSANLINQMQTYTRFNKGTLKYWISKNCRIKKFRTFNIFIEVFPAIESAGVLAKAWKFLSLYHIMVRREITNALITEGE